MPGVHLFPQSAMNERLRTLLAAFHRLARSVSKRTQRSSMALIHTPLSASSVVNSMFSLLLTARTNGRHSDDCASTLSQAGHEHSDDHAIIVSFVLWISSIKSRAVYFYMGFFSRFDDFSGEKIHRRGVDKPRDKFSFLPLIQIKRRTNLCYGFVS